MTLPEHDYWLNSALPPFAAFEHFLGFQIHKVAERMMAVEAAIQAEYGLSPPQYAILLGLREADGSNQLTLGVQLGIDRASMVRLLDKLESQQLAVRRVGTDRRERLVSITGEGRRVADEIEQRIRDGETRFLSTFDSAEQASLRAMIRRLLEVRPIGAAKLEHGRGGVDTL